MADRSEAAFREIQHRCSNDLQLVLSLCQMAANREPNADVAQSLRELTDRVAIFVHARSKLVNTGKVPLGAMLELIVESLTVIAEPRGVTIDLNMPDAIPPLSADLSTAAAIAVNELATNALKHAFAEQDQGEVRIDVSAIGHDFCTIKVADNGAPLDRPPAGERNTSGIGLNLARRTIAAHGGMLITPDGDSKVFEVRLPCHAASGRR